MPSKTANLEKFAWLSIAAAIATITLKAGAYAVSGSVGLLSDAAESIVNLIAAVIALMTLKATAKPADDGHHFGHHKAEYFSAAIEGLMIFVAAIVIIKTAVERLARPQALENVGLGLIISVIASAINGLVAWVLISNGKKYRSVLLKADGKHLLTDVWTSVGVVGGVGLVAVGKFLDQDWWFLDPIVALLVGANIIWTGWQLLHQSGNALLDASMDGTDEKELAAFLAGFTKPGEVGIHGVRTRVAGRQNFAEMHLLVPGEWSVTKGHDLCEEIESAARSEFQDLELVIHLEPAEDPRAFENRPAAWEPANLLSER